MFSHDNVKHCLWPCNQYCLNGSWVQRTPLYNLRYFQALTLTKKVVYHTWHINQAWKGYIPIFKCSLTQRRLALTYYASNTRSPSRQRFEVQADYFYTEGGMSIGQPTGEYYSSRMWECISKVERPGQEWTNLSWCMTNFWCIHIFRFLQLDPSCIRENEEILHGIA